MKGLSTMGKFEDAHKYLAKVTPKRPAVLIEMEKYAEKNDFPIIGPLAGRLLYQIAKMSNAKNILELGSGYGYSAFWFAMAMGKGGRLTLTDRSEELKTMAMDYFRRGRIKSRIDFKVGDALQTARKLKGKYDIVLSDIDKQDYPKTVGIAARLLKKGGIFITDNLLADGLVFAKNPQKKGKAVRSFTDKLYKDKRFFTTIVPLRDGISIAIRQ